MGGFEDLVSLSLIYAANQRGTRVGASLCPYRGAYLRLSEVIM